MHVRHVSSLPMLIVTMFRFRYRVGPQSGFIPRGQAPRARKVVRGHDLWKMPGKEWERRRPGPLGPSVFALTVLNSGGAHLATYDSRHTNE